MANVTLLHRDRQEEDYVGGKRQNLMTLVYNALYQQVDYSYRQNGQLSQMGEFSLFIRFGACCSWQLPPAGQSWVPEELGGYPAHMGIVAQAPHHIQVICKEKHKCSDDENRKHKERIKKMEDLNKIKANSWHIKGHQRKSNEMLLSNYYCSGPSPDAPACSKASNYGKRWQLLSTGETFSFSFLSFRVLSSWQRSPIVKLL